MLATALDARRARRRSASRRRRPWPLDGKVGEGLKARELRRGDGRLCLLGVGKMTQRCLAAAELLAIEGIEATVWDVRVVSPSDPLMLADALAHRTVITAEDGVRIGGAGTHLVDGLRRLSDERGEAMPAIRILGVPRRFLAQASPEAILSRLGSRRRRHRCERRTGASGRA